MFGFEWFPKAMDKSLAGFADNQINLGAINSHLCKPDCAVDVGMNHRATGVWFEGDALPCTSSGQGFR